ncbi:MAG: hypothetical protein U9R60_12050, partial [Bacteroidota bacterium]|nr:hypothetical protein [Bacteroidota bacterium]
RAGEIPPLKSVRDRLIRLYGAGIINDFEMSITDPNVTLVDIADRHKVSRQYVNQVFMSLYPKPYRYYQKKLKNAEKREIPTPSWQKSHESAFKSIQIRPKFVKICKKKGFKIEYSPNLNHYHLKINGKKTIIRASGNTYTTNLMTYHTYYRLSISDNHHNNAEILTFFHHNIGKFFIIPVSIIPKRLYIPSTKPRIRNKYWNNYIERWDLFEK